MVANYGIIPELNVLEHALRCIDAKKGRCFKGNPENRHQRRGVR